MTPPLRGWFPVLCLIPGFESVWENSEPRFHVSDIFISYASTDHPRIKPLVDALMRQGWSVWWDRAIPRGKGWDEVIEAELNNARCVIVV